LVLIWASRLFQSLLEWVIWGEPELFHRAGIARTFTESLLHRLDRRGLLAFLLPLTLYVLTLAPTIYNLDSAELTTAAASGGLMRSTGYPLYLILGGLWAWLPVRDVGYRLNLLSAVCGALTVALAERILRRWHVGPWAAFGALGLLATSPFFWGLSLVAEVYTLHTALMAGFILALLRWGENRSPRQLGVAALVAGLGMAHHVSTVLLGPAAVVYILSVSARKALSPRALLAALLGVLGGLSLYLYLPVRYLGNPAFNYAGVYDVALQFQAVNLATPAGLWWLVSGKAFAGQMFAYGGTEIWNETRNFFGYLWQAFFAVGIGPGVLGCALLLRRNWRQGSMLALMAIFSGLFFVNYRVLDKETMFLPIYLIWALWVGIGLQSLLDWVQSDEHSAFWQRGAVSLRIFVVSVALMAALWNWRSVDLSDDWSTRQRVETILQNAEPGALVFGWWDVVPALQYLQLVEGKRPDVTAINRFLIAPDDLAQAIEKEIKHRPVYIDSSSDNMSTSLRLKKVGPIYQVLARVQPGSRDDLCVRLRLLRRAGAIPARADCLAPLPTE